MFRSMTLRRMGAVLLLLALLGSACSGDDGVSSEFQPASPTDGDSSAPVDNDDGGSTGETESSTSDTETETETEAAPATPAVDPATLAALVSTDMSTKPAVDEGLLGTYDQLVIADAVVGDGATAEAGKSISMQYVGVLGADGTEFDSSWNRGTPFDFVLGTGQVIPGWDEGIVGMKVGGRRVLQIPSIQAYAGQARGDIIGENADLLFIVDLISIVETPEVPEDALGSFDEMGIIDIVEGTGETAEEGDIVAVQYLGVLGSDGTEFDSTWSRGAQPFNLAAGRANVIDGWNEGIPGMKVGGQRILQIPAAMAYGEEGSGGVIAPGDDLVFRIHLESVTKAPLAHTVRYEGAAPTEVETTTLQEGSGAGALLGETISAHVVVMFHSNSLMAQSSYVDGAPQPMAINELELLPGLAQGMLGITEGEIREVVLPALVAFPDGVPPDAGLGDDDAVVFIIESFGVQ